MSEIQKSNNPPHPTGPKLTKKNRLFCQYFTDLTDLETFGNGTKSAIKAGYSVVSARFKASHLLASAAIQNEIAHIEHNIKQQTDFTREEYVKQLMLNASMCRTEAVKARYWEMIGRAKGFIEPEDANKGNLALFQVLDSQISQRLGAIDKNNKMEVIDTKQDANTSDKTPTE